MRKIKTEFTKQGIAFLKKQVSKEKRYSVGQTDEQEIFFMAAYMAIKFPCHLYAEIIQPIIHRDAPPPGQAYDERGAMDFNRLWQCWQSSIHDADIAAKLTPYLRDCDGKIARILSYDNQPIFIESSLLDCIDHQNMQLFASSARRPLYAKGNMIQAIICPFSPKVVTDIDQTICQQDY